MNLLRKLTLWDATSIVVGTVIGTGIFLKTPIMSHWAGSPALVFLAWGVAGILSLAGALTYAELGSLFPLAGGEFVYLRESFGNATAFLYGWMRFWIAAPGSIAAFAVGAITFLSGVWDLGDSSWRTFYSVLLIVIFSGINTLQVSTAGKFQTGMTVLKIFLTLILSIMILLASSQGNWDHLYSTQSSIPWKGFGAAVLGALWAFDGWNNLSMTAGEIKDPQKVLPKALFGGILFVFLIYALTNLSYFYALPWGEILTAHSKLNPDSLPVATKAAQAAFGPMAVFLIAVLISFSALGAMNGSILASSRVPYAMAKEGLFFTNFGKLSKKNSVPYQAIFIQGFWASILTLWGSFDQLTDYVVFSSWLFYGMCALALFRFRKSHKDLYRSFRVPFYPYLPTFFLISTFLLLLNTLITAPLESLMGILLIATGLPVYWWKYSHSFSPN